MSETRVTRLREDWVPLSQAAIELGLSRPTLRERVARGELMTWVNPADRRQRLIRRRDLVRYARPHRQSDPARVA